MRRFAAIAMALTLCSCEGSKPPMAGSTPASGGTTVAAAATAAAPATSPTGSAASPAVSGSASPQASSVAATNGAKHKPSQAETDAVREALLRHIFKKNASGAQQTAKTFFIRIDDKDPDESFLKRFAGHKPPVDVGSKFKVGEGLLFHVESFEWIDANTVEAAGGYYEGNLSSSGNSYLIERKDGVWQVTKDIMRWIS